MKHYIKIDSTSEAGMHRPGVYGIVFKTKHRIQGRLNECYVNYQN